jgi:hypothetical protein
MHRPIRVLVIGDPNPGALFHKLDGPGYCFRDILSQRLE